MEDDKTRQEIFGAIKAYYARHMNKPHDAMPASAKKFDEDELILAVDAVLDGWWTEGEKTQRFTEGVSRFLGVTNTIMVNSGSSANLLALKALTSRKLANCLRPGMEVITVAAGFPTTVNSIVECGCTPVFCDIDIPTYNINTKEMEKALSQKTKAVFLAHTLGNPFDISRVADFCKENNLWLVEDNCDSLGSTYRGRLTGTFGDMSTLSFYPAHHITTGEGGAVCTSNDELAKIATSMRDWGRHCYCKTGQDNTCGNRFSWKLGDLPYGYDHKYIYSEIGYNLKSTDIMAAIGIAQLRKLPDFIKIRKRNFQLIKQALSEFEEYLILPKETPGSDPCWFGFPMTLSSRCSFSRERLLLHLNSRKIGTRLLFGGNLTKQPYFIENKIRHRSVGDLACTDTVMSNSFWIGVHPLIDEAKVDLIHKAFSDFFGQVNRKPTTIGQ